MVRKPPGPGARPAPCCRGRERAGCHQAARTWLAGRCQLGVPAVRRSAGSEGLDHTRQPSPVLLSRTCLGGVVLSAAGLSVVVNLH